MNVDPSRVFVSWAVYYSDRGDFSSIFHAEVEHHGYWLILLCFPFVRSLSFSCGSETGWDGKHCFRQQNESIVNLQSIWRGWLVTSEHRNWWLANMKLCCFRLPIRISEVTAQTWNLVGLTWEHLNCRNTMLCSELLLPRWSTWPAAFITDGWTWLLGWLKGPSVCPVHVRNKMLWHATMPLLIIQIQNTITLPVVISDNIRGSRYRVLTLMPGEWIEGSKG